MPATHLTLALQCKKNCQIGNCFLGKQFSIGKRFTETFLSEKLCKKTFISLCSLILDNAISNAFKHGHPKRPNVHFVIEEAAEAADNPTQVRLRFMIINAVNPVRPRVTAAYVKRVLDGEAEPAQSALSDQIGLQHSFLAGEVQGMKISLTQNTDSVVFDARMDVDIAAAPVVLDMPDEDEGAEFPPGLTICCIDDSPSARRQLQHHLVTCASATDVHVFGQNEKDVARFMGCVSP